MKKYLPLIILFVVAATATTILVLNNGKKTNSSTNTGQTAQPTPIISKSPSTQIANPASENCVKVGGTVKIQDGPNGQYALCDFGDNMACEEWTLLRGECPVGGVKTTGFDSVEQKYCAWLGGKTVAEENASCTLPSGKVCSDKDLYSGKCS